MGSLRIVRRWRNDTTNSYNSSMSCDIANKEILSMRPTDAVRLMKQHTGLDELVIVNPEWKDGHEHVEVGMFNPEFEFEHFSTTVAVVKYWPTGEKYIDYVTGIKLRIKRVGQE